MNKDWERKAHVPLHVIVVVGNEVGEKLRPDPEQQTVPVAGQTLFAFSPEQGWTLNVRAGTSGDLGTRHGLRSLKELTAAISPYAGVRVLELTDVAGGHLHLLGDVEVHFRLGNRSIGEAENRRGFLTTMPRQRLHLLLFLGVLAGFIYSVLCATK